MEEINFAEFLWKMGLVFCTVFAVRFCWSYSCISWRLFYPLIKKLTKARFSEENVQEYREVLDQFQFRRFIEGLLFIQVAVCALLMGALFFASKDMFIPALCFLVAIIAVLLILGDKILNKFSKKIEKINN